MRTFSKVVNLFLFSKLKFWRW